MELEPHLVTVVFKESIIILLINQSHPSPNIELYIFKYWNQLWGEKLSVSLNNTFDLNRKVTTAIGIDNSVKTYHYFLICLQPAFSHMKYQAWKHLERF